MESQNSNFAMLQSKKLQISRKQNYSKIENDDQIKLFPVSQLFANHER